MLTDKVNISSDELAVISEMASSLSIRAAASLCAHNSQDHSNSSTSPLTSPLTSCLCASVALQSFLPGPHRFATYYTVVAHDEFRKVNAVSGFQGPFIPFSVINVSHMSFKGE